MEKYTKPALEIFGVAQSTAIADNFQTWIGLNNSFEGAAISSFDMNSAQFGEFNS